MALAILRFKPQRTERTEGKQKAVFLSAISVVCGG